MADSSARDWPEPQEKGTRAPNSVLAVGEFFIKLVRGGNSGV
jgi:hypothetical protein